MTNEPPPHPGEPDPSASEPHDPRPSSEGVPPQSPGGYPPPAGHYYPPPAGHYYPPPPGAYPPLPGGYAPPGESNKKAIWSMILGILSVPPCCGVILGPIAIVLSYQAKNEIDQSRGTQTGVGMATAGLVLGIIGIVVWVLNAVIRVAQFT